jgi:4-hydroxyphenylpyruvate dioxygenase-like putative hemolysin
MEILNQGFDHVEFAVNDIQPMSMVFQRMGFEKIGERKLAREGTKSALYAQGYVRILLTQSDHETAASVKQVPESMKFLKNHAEGICVLALDVKDATQAYQEAVKRGARPAREPQTYHTPEGKVSSF